ncbi:MAG: flagellar basal body-associated FliL family protein [Gammaproteobacteria bacterium]|nr:flagellar basal body-associated FliL family protein [Gammaproteobacteria bacterium]
MFFLINLPKFRRYFFMLLPACAVLFFSIVTSNAYATTGLPTQKERFAGMSGAFKEKKKEAEDAKAAAEEKAKLEAEQKSLEGAEATYFRLHTFVVNVIDQREPDRLFFLTLEIYSKIYNSDDRWIVNTHLAPIKDIIISSVSGLERQDIQTQKQKKALQKQLTQKVSNLLKKLSGKNVISDLYLTRIIVQ